MSPFLEVWGRSGAAKSHYPLDLESAREQPGQAEALFRDMGIDWWTEQAEGLRGGMDNGEPFK